MWKWMLAMLVLPISAGAQEMLRSGTGAGAVKLLETQPIQVAATTNNRIDVSFRAEGKTFFLRITGTGEAAHTINTEDPAIFLLENDSTVTLKAIAVQGYNDMDSVRTFSHNYALQQPELEMLSRSRVQAFRKYSVIGFDEFSLDKTAAENLKVLSTTFLQMLDREQLLKKVVVTEPAFPGGKDVLLSFINKNLKQLPVMRSGEKKAVQVTFQVLADGSVQQFEVKQSAGAVFDNELLRILRRMPRWKPALADGSPIDRTVVQKVIYYQDAEKVKISF